MVSITSINGLNLVAEKLLTARDIQIAGDATGTASFDGSQNITITATLANTSTARTNLGLGTVATLNTGIASGNVPVLDENGKLSTSVLPAIGITDVFVKTDITADTEANALQALKTYVTGLTTQQGDIVIYTYSWTSPTAGSLSGTIIQTANYGEGDSETQKWEKWVQFNSADSEAIDALTAQISAHIGSNGTTAHAIATTDAAGFMPALPSTNAATSFLAGNGTWINHVGLGGTAVHAVATTTDAGFMPTLPTDNQTTSVIVGNGTWVNHIGLGGNAHAVATTASAGFIPALPSTDAAGQYLDGTGVWTPLPASSTTVTVSGATPQTFTKVGDHWCVAVSSTEAIAAGVVTYGTGLTIGANVYIKTDDSSVIYTTPSTAGTYVHVGYVVSATQIELSANQTEYVLV